MIAHLTVRQREGVTILDVTGEFTLRDKVWQALEAGSVRILLNMAGMNRIDSFGIGELVKSTRKTSSFSAKRLSSFFPRCLDYPV